MLWVNHVSSKTRQERDTFTFHWVGVIDAEEFIHFNVGVCESLLDAKEGLVGVYKTLKQKPLRIMLTCVRPETRSVDGSAGGFYWRQGLDLKDSPQKRRSLMDYPGNDGNSNP
jgi:hypothetical protein